jgi:hypothetical protein
MSAVAHRWRDRTSRAEIARCRTAAFQPGYAADIATFTFVGEVLFMLWLLVKARNTAT